MSYLKASHNADFRLDFIGIGAAKAGTTWLADALRQHPQVFIPAKKELFYFNRLNEEYEEVVENVWNKKPLSWYQAFFDEAQAQQRCGEICNPYLSDAAAAQAIYQYNPNIKLLAVLRQPLERAFSHYNYNRHRHHVQYPPFEKAVQRQPSFLKHGLYAEHLSRYYTLFPKSQIGVFFYEDMKADAQLFYKKILDFLELDEYYPPVISQKSNETKTPRFKALNRSIDSVRHFLHRRNLHFILPFLRKSGIAPAAEWIRDHLNAQKSTQKDTLDTKTIEYLQPYFSADIDKLEVLLNKDLSHWKLNT